MEKLLRSGVVIATLFTLLSATVSIAQEALPEGHPDVSQMELPAVEIDIIDMPPIGVAVLEGTLGGDVDALFKEMMEHVEAQGLWGSESGVGLILPAGAFDVSGTSVIYVGVSVEDNSAVEEPLFGYTVPGGEYLMAVHIGPYEESGATWMQLIDWAMSHGIKIAEAPAFEHYLDNPDEVAAEDLRCEIYIPLDLGQGHGEMVMEGHGDMHGDMHEGQAEAVEGAPDFDVMIETLDSDVYFIYIEGTVSDSYDEMIRKAISICAEQDLLETDMMAGAIYPDAMVNGYSENTPVYFGIAIESAPDVDAPLDLIEMPQGDYLIVMHSGPYEDIGGTWMATFEWAEGHGIEFADGICGEMYMSDPDETPAEELISAIFIPLVPGQAHGPDHPGYVGGQWEDDEGMDDEDDDDDD